MQVPPPPQADGKNILLFPRVFNKVAPDDTLRSSCPFIFNATGPEGSNFALTPKSIVTNNKIIPKKTTILTKTKVKSINYNLIPIKLINPIAIRPVIIKVIPNPFKGSGILEYAIFSLIAEIARIAKKKPTPDPKP